MNQDEPLNVKYYQPHEVGMQRRPELDTIGTEAWEWPNGTLQMYQVGQKISIVVFSGLEVPLTKLDRGSIEDPSGVVGVPI